MPTFMQMMMNLLKMLCISLVHVEAAASDTFVCIASNSDPSKCNPKFNDCYHFFFIHLLRVVFFNFLSFLTKWTFKSTPDFIFFFFSPEDFHFIPFKNISEWLYWQILSQYFEVSRSDTALQYNFFSEIQLQSHFFSTYFPTVHFTYQTNVT